MVVFQMNEDNIKISVIIPTLNVKKYIKQCIESVINQTFSDIEILCVDGGSDDGTLEILKEYSQIHGNLHVFLSNKKSYGSQVNQGIVNAKGDYIAFVDDDDVAIVLHESFTHNRIVKIERLFDESLKDFSLLEKSKRSIILINR